MYICIYTYKFIYIYTYIYVYIYIDMYICVYIQICIACVARTHASEYHHSGAPRRKHAHPHFPPPPPTQQHTHPLKHRHSGAPRTVCALHRASVAVARAHFRAYCSFSLACPQGVHASRPSPPVLCIYSFVHLSIFSCIYLIHLSWFTYLFDILFTTFFSRHFIYASHPSPPIIYIINILEI